MFYSHNHMKLFSYYKTYHKFTGIPRAQVRDPSPGRRSSDESSNEGEGEKPFYSINKVSW